MYDELIKRLRKCTAEQNGEKTLWCQAADAIEELSKLADAIPHVCECCAGCELEKKNGGCDHAFVLSPKRAMQYLIEPRWIPVTERLPDVFKHVLVNIPGMALLRHPTVQEAFREKNGMWYSNGFRYEEDEITHWMPLPEPPKGERKEQ